MNRQIKDMFLFEDDEIYAEAKRRIKECRKNKSKKLDLSKLNLKEIPPEIAELQFLEELDITCYDLINVPGFIGNIVSLKKLSVGSRSISAHEREKIILSDELSNLKNLKNLSLGNYIPEIPPWVCKLDNLEALSIFNDSIKTIPEAIANIKNLSKLRIHANKIDELPKEIGEKLSLTALELRCPQLKTMPESFANLKSMKDFIFERCNLTAIPNYICGWTNLEAFELSMENTFQGPVTKLKNIPRNIGNLKKLKYLNLDGANIEKIPESLGDCPLQYIELSGSFKNVPETLGNCSKLKILKLFSDKPISLHYSLGKLSLLRKLEINVPALEVPESIGKLSSLEEFFLITQKDLVLPKSIGNLSALKKIWIESGQMRRIPDSIGNCKNLRYIAIESDKLTALPQSLCKLKMLRELHIDAFALKTLPANFGGLLSLKITQILSGALTAIPESMCNLKKLEWLGLDAHNVKYLPDAFKKLSYVKHKQIEIGKNDTLEKHKSKIGDPSYFKELADMSLYYRVKLVQKYSIKQLEKVLCSAPMYYYADEKERKVFRDIMIERRCRLNGKFKWTEGNKKRIAKVSDEFLKAWEEGYLKAKMIIETQYEKEKNIKSFNDKYSIDITLHPEVLFDGDDHENEKLYDIITSYIDYYLEMNMRIKYDPVTKNDDGFKENIYIKRDLSWNIEGFGDIDLEGYYICYALHILYSHNNWAFYDIPKINNIITEIKVRCDGENF